MPVSPEDRPLTSVREETIDRLIVNYGHGKLSLEAFERRLDEALDAQTVDALLALTGDLPLEAADTEYARQKRAEFGVQTEPVPHARDVDYMIHVFGGGNRAGAWTVAPEIRLVNVFGGCEIDFSNARFSSPMTRIKLFCLFGGANFLVNEEANVLSRVACVFGGIDNRGPSNTSPDVPTIVVEGLVLFGGASIKIKRTLRERWLMFANHVRQAFGPAR